MASEIRELPRRWSSDHLFNRASAAPVKPGAASLTSTEMFSLHITFEGMYGEVRRRLAGDSVLTGAHAPTVPALSESPNWPFNAASSYALRRRKTLPMSARVSRPLAFIIAWVLTNLFMIS